MKLYPTSASRYHIPLRHKHSKSSKKIRTIYDGENAILTDKRSRIRLFFADLCSICFSEKYIPGCLEITEYRCFELSLRCKFWKVYNSVKFSLFWTILFLNYKGEKWSILSRKGSHEVFLYWLQLRLNVLSLYYT